MVSVAVLYLCLKSVAGIYFHDAVVNSWGFHVMASALLLLAFPYMQVFYRAIATRLVFRTYYGYQESLRDLTQMLTRLIRVDEIVNTLIFTLPALLKVAHVAVIVKNKNGRYITLGQSGNWADIHVELLPHLTAYLAENRDVLVQEELSFQASFDENDIRKQASDAICDEMARVGASVALPLVVGGDDLGGMILLGSRRGVAAFSKENIHLMQGVAHHVSAALQNAIYFERLEQSRTQMQVLNDYLIRVNATFDYTKILEFTSQTLSILFDVEWTVAFSYDDDDCMAPVFSSIGRIDKFRDLRVPYSLFQDGRFSSGFKEAPFFIQSSYQNSLEHILSPILQQKGMASAVVLPVIYQGDLRGFLLGCFSRSRTGYSVSRSEVIDNFSQVSNAAISHALLFSDLHDAREFNAEVLRHLTSGVILCDQSMRITTINLRASQCFGIQTEAYIGQPISSL